MKIKLKDLNPNPFKKEINGGKLNTEIVDKIKANIKELGLMGALPIFEKNGKKYLIAGHHRCQALKETYGKDFEVEVINHKYSDEQVLRGMVVENLTQRYVDMRETVENLAVIRKHLKSNSVQSLNEIKKTITNPKGAGREEEAGSIRQIHDWLNKNGKVLSIGRISECLQVFDKLAPELIDQVKKTQASSAIERDEALQETQAVYLARIEDHGEQKKLAKALKSSREQKVRKQGKLITKYKEAKISQPEVAKEILAGKRDLADVGFPKISPKVSLNQLAYNHVVSMQDNLTWFKNNIPGFKKRIANVSTSELTQFLMFMRSWGTKEFAPLYKYIQEEVFSREGKESDDKKIFIFTDEEMKGGK